MARVLLADSQPLFNEALGALFSRDDIHQVRTHIQNILEKLGMHSKLEAATFAMQRSMELELTPGGAGGDH